MILFYFLVFEEGRIRLQALWCDEYVHIYMELRRIPFGRISFKTNN